jgi:putative transposase
MLNYLEHKTCPNLLKQNFKINEERKLFSTDVTYFFNKNGSKAYLSAVKDLETNEIVGFEISKTNDLDFVIRSVKKSLKGFNNKNLIIHSDQGYQYTHEAYQGFLKENNVTQSMSRRGNCLDNAPIESFFGHLKDEFDYRSCKNIEELNRRIRNYIKFYNEKRPQWGLQRKTPVEYRSFIK